VVAEFSYSVAVMYAGRIVERGPKADILARSRHPYTVGLLASQPEAAPPRQPLPAIPGQPPGPGEAEPACRFHRRCPQAREKCRQVRPPLDRAGPAHETACIRHRELWPEDAFAVA
jgi:oligopeptide/dipeptide ABC transporter ATP-binding protein